MAYKYFGLLAFTLLVTGLAFLVHKRPLDRHKTFSQRAATSKAFIIYYFVLFLVVLPMFIVFFVGWFTPTFAVSWWFNGIFIVSAAFQIACTLVPETGSRMTSWHRLLAGTSAILLMPPLLILMATGNIPILAQAFTAISLGIMLTCIYLALRAPNREPRNFLLIQCLYFGAFLAPIMIISYAL